MKMNNKTQYPCSIEDIRERIATYENLIGSPQTSVFDAKQTIEMLYDYALLRFGINLKLEKR